jgi:hypothetical protein
LLIVALSAWAALLFDYYPLHLEGNAQLALQFVCSLPVLFCHPSIIKLTCQFVQAPFLALVAFGVYSLVRILYNLAIFPVCPEALTEMRKEMKEAEADLKKKGFKFPNKKTD